MYFVSTKVFFVIMGIRGLSTFIAHYSYMYLEDYKLRDCQLVIDGNSLCAQIYTSSSNFNCAFGGDYDRYALSVIEFFFLLKKCKVAPIVIFDGGYEKRKMKTVYSRLKEKWHKIKEITLVNQSAHKVFPLLLREAFKDVLRELHVPFVQSLFEADEEIAAIAKQLKCPVLSYDSDFFVYDVLYIPFPTLRFHAYKDELAESADDLYYLSCSLYRVDNFIRHYKGLQKEMLPFISIMLGNDYIGNKIFKNFVSHLKQSKSRRTHPRKKRITALLQWLQTETLETATEKVMNCLKKENRQCIKEQIGNVISLYEDCSSELSSILGIETFDEMKVETSGKTRMKQLLQKHLDRNDVSSETEREICPGDKELNNEISNNICNSSEEEYISEMENSEDENESELSPEKMNMEAEICEMSERQKASYLPKWFLEKFQKGTLPPFLMDLLILGKYFVPPQVEACDYPSSHSISLPIISVIFGLMNDCGKGRFLKCYIRKSGELKHFVVLYPVLETSSVKFPSLHELPKLSLHQRLLILEETAGLSIVDQTLVALLPSSWQLYVLSLLFWARKCEEPRINDSHIDALLLCLLLFDVVGKNAICLGSAKKKKRRKQKLIKEVHLYSNDKTALKLALTANNYKQPEVLSNSLECVTDNPSKTENGSDQVEDENEKDFVSLQQKSHNNDITDLHTKLFNLAQCFETVNSEECALVKKLLRPWSLMDEKLKSRPRAFCVLTVHTFAQFQSSLLHFTYLNALLDFPLSHCISFRAFCGTFVYNMYHNLKHRKNAFAYITQLLSGAPSILLLFTTLKEMVEKLALRLPNTEKVQPKQRKKKRLNLKNEDVDVLHDMHDEATDIDFEDPNNRFTALTVND